MNYKKALLKLSLILAVCLCSLPSAAMEITKDEADNALKRLDDSLKLSARYISERENRINSLKNKISRSNPTPAQYGAVGQAYISFNNDSALLYLDRAISVSSDSTAKLQYILRRTSLLPLAGFTEVAETEFDSINPASLPDSLKILYYQCGKQMYDYIASFFSSYDNYAENMKIKAAALQDSLLTLLNPSGLEYKYNMAEHYYFRQDMLRAQTYFTELFLDPKAKDYRARAAHHLSQIAAQQDDQNAYIFYLAESALADVTTATLEVISLQQLGTLMYQQGDVTRAYEYLSQALANAVACGAPLRMIETSRSLPYIEQAYSAELDSRKRTIYIILGVIIALMLGLVGVLLLLHRRIVMMRKLQHNLRKANTAKEVYISQFLTLCSIYMDKLNQFCKIATRKISSGKVDDLYRLTKSGKFVEEQSKEFYEVFDNAFLHIYPNFVNEVNKLLRPDAQITLAEGELLNTDLRILAFMRLGIEESSRIAQVLNYSLNTIYAYRNRIKSRAIARESFEKDIMKIDSYI